MPRSRTARDPTIVVNEMHLRAINVHPKLGHLVIDEKNFDFVGSRVEISTRARIVPRTNGAAVFTRVDGRVGRVPVTLDARLKNDRAEHDHRRKRPQRDQSIRSHETVMPSLENCCLAFVRVRMFRLTVDQ
jgi:hypothetical protein